MISQPLSWQLDPKLSTSPAVPLPAPSSQPPLGTRLSIDWLHNSHTYPELESSTIYLVHTAIPTIMRDMGDCLSHLEKAELGQILWHFRSICFHATELHTMSFTAPRASWRTGKAPDSYWSVAGISRII